HGATIACKRTRFNRRSAGVSAHFELPALPVRISLIRWGFMRAIHAHWIISIPLILTWCFLCELQAQTPPPSVDELTQAQIENQRAQATYYQRQADKRGFWRSLREYGGPIG